MPHRLIGSSVPGEVEAAQAKALLYERLVLSSAVCRHLAQSSSYIDPLPTTALTLLLRWVADHYEAHVETHPSDGLSTMMVPAGSRALMSRLVKQAEICEAYAMMFTADTQNELRGDEEEITRLLKGYVLD